MKKLIFTLPFILAACTSNNTGPVPSGQLPSDDELPSQVAEQQAVDAAALAHAGLQTNTSKISIPFEEILSGGPGKDGIPAISNPQFATQSDTDYLKSESRGILVDIDGEQRFYSYDILFWHEIVNDTIGDTPVAVTFCPLCGSAIAFDRRVEDEVLEFGVSGLLWQSNLLMYDTSTESLWSQIEGQAKVGDFNETKLTILNSQVITYGQVQQNFPNALVQKTPTEFSRSYGQNPYGTYEEDTQMIFPVNSEDDRFHPKDIFAVTTVNGTSVGFNRKELATSNVATLDVDGTILTATLSDDGTITIADETGTVYPMYHAMWFSWINHNPGLVFWPER